MIDTQEVSISEIDANKLIDLIRQCWMIDKKNKQDITATRDANAHLNTENTEFDVFNYNISREVAAELDNFLRIRIDMFHATKKHIKRLERSYPYLDPISFIKEYGTIQLFLGRQTGSSYFQHHIQKLILNDEHAAFIFPTLRMQQDFVSSDTHAQNNQKYYTNIDTARTQFCGMKFDYLVVDCSYLMTPEQIELMYDIAVHGDAKMVLLL